MLNANVSNDDPRGCFQVFAERKYMLDVKGYQNFRGSFHSLHSAQLFAEVLAANTDYYTGYSWVQVADVFTGKVWGLEGCKWLESQAGA